MCLSILRDLASIESVTVVLNLSAGVDSFLLYSVQETIRGIPLDPSDKSDALMPVSGIFLGVGIDFHAGESKHICLSTSPVQR